MNWSNYQLAIFEAVRDSTDSLIIEAVAGSGKTTTIVEAIRHVPQDKSVVFLAFNKAIQQTLANRVTAPNATCATLHSMGLRAWKRFIGSEAGARLKVDSGKTFGIIKELLTWEQRRRYPALARVVALGKQMGIVPNGRVKLEGQFLASGGLLEQSGAVEHVSEATKGRNPAQNDRNGQNTQESDTALAGLSLADLPEDEPTTTTAWCQGLVEDTTDNWLGLMDEYDIDPEDVQLDLVRRVLRESIVRSPEVIDFDDMLLMPVVAGSRFDKYDVVFVDECQDLNGIQHEMVGRMVAGRVVAVGDQNQSVYRFRGAMADSMEMMARRFNCRALPLSISYRCPQRVVELAKKWVDAIEVAPNAIEGLVVEYPEHTSECIKSQDCKCPSTYAKEEAALASLCPQHGNEIECTCGSLKGGWLMKDFRASDVILCRLTRPLVEVAFRLIRARIPCRVLGRDIGQGLVRLVEKSKLGDNTSIHSFSEWLDSYEHKEKEKLRLKEEWGKIGLLEDKLQTLRVFMDDLELDDTILKLKQEIEGLFKDDNGAGKITCATVHKAKGGEWSRVFILDAHELMPLKWASNVREEANIAYVAATRAQQELYYLKSKHIR